MITTQITLSETENQAIQIISERRGQTPEEILHEAVEQFLNAHQVESRLVAMRQARGIWKDREDLPDFAALREEWDRS